MNNLSKSYIAAVMLALTFLAFVAGYAVNESGMLRGTVLDDAMQAARSVVILMRESGDELGASNRFTNARESYTGVVTHERDRVSPGYTLYVTGEDTSAYLIDADGEVVWRWHLPFDAVWPQAEHLQGRPGARDIFWRKAELLPNGDLLVLYDGENVTPHGIGLARIDKDSKLLWKLSDNAHHDVQVDPDGNIYTLTYRIRNEKLGPYQYLDPPMITDDVVILDPDGNELKRFPLDEAIIRSSYRSLLLAVTPNEKGDYFHSNSVHPVSAAAAASLDFANQGDILISLRELATVVLLDGSSGALKWAMRGPWIGQHDAEFLPDGNMLVFDNKGDISSRHGNTRVLEFDPQTGQILWQFAGTKESPFSTGIRGAQQRLPNGNTLITESNNARLLEVTPAGEVVWDYRNPARSAFDESRVPVLMWGLRYPESYPEFL